MARANTIIELWLVDLEQCAAGLEALERDAPRLADDDRDRAGAIGDLRERRHRLTAYTALRVLLERVVGAGVRGRPFVRGPGGKPRIEEGGAEFSVSHTQGLALIGVTRALPIGVDLEKARVVRMAPRRHGEILAAGVGLGDKPLPDLGTDRAFLQAWARLEAFTKARGRALALTLADLDLRGKGRQQVPLTHVGSAARRLAREAGLMVRDVKLPPGLHGAVAAPRGARLARVRLFPTEPAGLEQ